MELRRWTKVPVAALAAIALSVAMVGYTDGAQTARTNAVAPIAIIAPSRVNLPAVPAEALQMSEAGVSDNSIISYIQKSDHSYTLDASQIIYLHDLGMSSAVLQALVAHAGTAAGNQTTEAGAGTAETQNVTSTTTPPVSGTAADFYDALAPYGSWVNVPTYGWCWQPTVVVINSGWQPYCNNGRWLWTDQGWYWNSYYSWGWAPFHYGRWCRYPGYGWLWCPGNTWGPAWVCWRDYPGYCGWAPLPPGAVFNAGIGWTFNGLAVGFNFGFGLGPQCFTFCDYDHFCGRHPYDYFRRGRDADRFFHHSRVDNNYAVDAHHHFINRGIAPSHIEAVTHTRIHEVSVREWPHRHGGARHFIVPDRLTRSGNRWAIYRPGHNLSDVRNHFQVEHHGLKVGRWHNNTASPGFTFRHEIGRTPRFQPNHWNDLHYSKPDVSLDHSHGHVFNRHWNPTGTPQIRHSPSKPDYHRDYSASRRFTPTRHFVAPIRHFTPAPHPTPAWHSAPAWHHAPASHSAPAWHSAPSHFSGGRIHSGGGAHFRGGSTHFGGRAGFHGGFHR